MNSVMRMPRALMLMFGVAMPLSAFAAAGGGCPVPTRLEAGGGSKVIKPPTDAPGIALQKGDRLRRVGRSDEAAEIYRSLLSTPRDQRQTSRKAQLRLAQYELSNNRFDAARLLVEEATRAGANDGIKREAAYIYERIDYDLALSAAELKFSQLEISRRSSQNPVSLVPQYEALLALPCPIPDDFRFELHDRMAVMQADAGNFDGARQQLALSEAELTRISEPRLTALRDRLVQKISDLDARAAFASAEQAASEAVKRQQYDLVLAILPAPSPQLRVRAHLLAADSYMRAKDFAAAAQRIELASKIPTNEERPASLRIENAQAKLEERKADYQFRQRLQEINTHRTADPRAAIGQYRTLIEQNSQAQALPQAKIALADAYRQARYYREARTLLSEVSQQQNLPENAERIVREQERLEKNRPDSSLRAQFRVASYYDTNAPTLATELREEVDGIAFPLDQKFDDGVVNIDARLAHSARISDDYHYWETEFHARKTEQFDLSQIDRLIFDVNSGPSFNLPDQAAVLKVAGLFLWESRGGEFLRSNYGGTIELDKRLSQKVDGKIFFSAVRNNDTRSFLDATFLQLRGSLDYKVNRSARIAPIVVLERRDTRDQRFDNMRLSLGGSYSHQWGDEGLRKGVDLDLRYQWVRYDRELGVLPRNDRRFQAGVMGWADITPNIRAFAEFRHNNPGSNYVNFERLANDRIGAGLTFTID